MGGMRGTGPLPECDLVLPCKDEAPALEQLLPALPDHLHPIVVDNGSRDDTAATAQRLGATVVHEEQPGYGAAVHAGLVAARRDLVAVMDGDGSFDAADLEPLLRDVDEGRADIAVGRRRASAGADGARAPWPWHARAGNRAVLWWLRRRTGLSVHDIAPMRVVRREPMLALGVQDRRFGYPVELLQRAHLAGWRFTEHDVRYLPRAEGTRSKVSGSVRGSLRAARDFARVLV